MYICIKYVHFEVLRYMHRLMIPSLQTKDMPISSKRFLVFPFFVCVCVCVCGNVRTLGGRSTNVTSFYLKKFLAVRVYF